MLLFSFIIAVAGIFGGFSFMAVKQEDVYKTSFGKTEGKDGSPGEKFAFTFFALAAERGINALIALAGVLAFGGSGNKIPHMEIFNSGVSQMLAMAASNEALRYVSYPTQVLGKSCKMVPVMAGGLLLGGKSYTLFEYLQVALITGGVVVFNFGGKKKGGDAADSAYGLVLIALSLIMDMVCRAHAHAQHTCTCTAHMHTCACAHGHAHAHGARTLGRPTRALTLATTVLPRAPPSPQPSPSPRPSPAPRPPQVTGGLQDKVKKSTKELNPSAKSVRGQ